MGPLIATVFFLGMAWLCFTLASNVVATNSYESIKRDSRRFMGVICLLIGGLSGWYTIEQLVKPDKPVVVRKVIKHRKPKPSETTEPESTEEK